MTDCLDGSPECRKIVYQTFVQMKEMKERVDRHTQDHKDNLNRVWTKLDEIKSLLDSVVHEQSATNQDHEVRLTKIESEKGVVGKIIAAFVAMLSGVVGAIVGRHVGH